MGSRWKLHLRPKHLASSINRDDDLPPLPSGKHAVHVLTDFIKYLSKCAKTYIEERHLAFSWLNHEDSIEYIFTHPNGWEGVQQQLYRRAIVAAGLVPATPEGQARVHLLTDGEASLHFCVAELVSAEIPKQDGPQGVVIIDAGGATVNLSMFSVMTSPITCEEIAPVECTLLSITAKIILTGSYPFLGRLQGSAFVTRRAKLLLESSLIVSSSAFPFVDELRKSEKLAGSAFENIAEYTREFDQGTKLVIKSDQEPAYVRVAGLRTRIPKYNISFGKLKLTG